MAVALSLPTAGRSPETRRCGRFQSLLLAREQLRCRDIFHENTCLKDADVEKTDLTKTGFARHIMVVFLVGTASILILDLLEDFEFIGELTESLSRFVIWVVLLAMLARSARVTRLDRRVLIMGCITFGSLLFELGLGILMDVVPSTREAGLVIKRLTTAGWSCGSLFLIFALISSVERSQKYLQRRVEKRTRRLSEANAHLELEIDQRRQVEESLKQTENAVEAQRELNRQLAAALLKLRETQSQLIQQERLSALGQIARGLAHDLNNALTPVAAYSELMLKSASGEQRQALEHVAHGARHSAGIIKQLQYFCQPSAADEPHEYVRLCDVIRGAIALTRPRWQDVAIENGVEIHVREEVDDDLTIFGNAVELTQLYTNLILNAADAMPDGGTITARALAEDSQVFLEVEDDGRGMSEEVRHRCFEPYFSDKENGCGLGLSVCHGIVERHAGRIDIRDLTGGGTCFRITLPRGETTAEEPSVESVENAFYGKHVLYIDDDDVARTSIGLLLGEMGITVDLASNGRSGLDLAQARSYDLVITDLGMADLTGVDVFYAIKSHSADLPVIIVSGWSRREVLNRFDSGLLPEAIIEKPLTPGAIGAALSRLQLTDASARSH